MSELTKEDFAAMLNGRQYREEITRSEREAARAAGLIVAFGSSDDLLELHGAVDDEVGAFGGGEVSLTTGLIIIREIDGIDEEELIRNGWTPPKAAFSIKAEWLPSEPEASWLITSSLPYASFDIMEDGELYCRCIVIDTKDIAP